MGVFTAVGHQGETKRIQFLGELSTFIKKKKERI